MSRKQSRGFGLFEILIFIIVMMIFIAIPNFIKYSQRAKTAEAVMNVSTMATNARLYYMSSSADKLHKFPSSVGPTPEGFACRGATPIKYDPQAFQGAIHFGHENWRDLNFNLSKPFKYRYTFLSQGEGTSAIFTARAEGDLDCDGEPSLFERAGYVDSNGQVVITNLYRQSELE